MRIDEANRIISDDCRDWMLAVSKTKWLHSYINDGKEEIKEALAVCNTIPNVSAVVFKKETRLKLSKKPKNLK